MSRGPDRSEPHQRFPETWKALNDHIDHILNYRLDPLILAGSENESIEAKKVEKLGEEYRHLTQAALERRRTVVDKLISEGMLTLVGVQEDLLTLEESGDAAMSDAIGSVLQDILEQLVNDLANHEIVQILKKDRAYRQWLRKEGMNSSGFIIDFADAVAEKLGFSRGPWHSGGY